jgi:hypothetical protein
MVPVRSYCERGASSPMGRLAVVLGVASACGGDGERKHEVGTDGAAEARWSAPRETTQPNAACAPGGDRGEPPFCGIAPAGARTDTGSAVRVTTVTGEAFWLVLPHDRTRLVAVQGVPVRLDELASTPMTALTTAEPRRAADRYRADFPACRAVAVEREVFSNRAVVTRWDDASGTLRDLDVTTARLGRWTLVLHGDH